MLLIPFVILTLTDSSPKKILKHILLSLWVGGISLIVQYICARYLGAETPAILGSMAAILAIVVYARLFAGGHEPAAVSASEEPITLSRALRAWSVYGFILFFIVISGPLVKPINEFLRTHLVSHVHLPIYAEGKYFSFGWISNAGLMLFLGTFIGGMIQGVSAKKLFVVLARTVKNLNKTVITIMSLVSIASVMNYAGMIGVIASALVSATGAYYPLFVLTQIGRASCRERV